MNPVELRRTLLKCCAGLALVTLLSACGGSGDGAPTPSPSPSPGPSPTPTPAPVQLGVSFSTNIQPIFNAHCIGCHIIGGLAGNILVLNSGTYTNLLGSNPAIGRTAAASPGTLVVVGDSANSVLVKRITGDLSVNLLRMPLGGPFLSASDITLIKTWIDEGAKNN